MYFSEKFCEKRKINHHFASPLRVVIHNIIFSFAARLWKKSSNFLKIRRHYFYAFLGFLSNRIRFTRFWVINWVRFKKFSKNKVFERSRIAFPWWSRRPWVIIYDVREFKKQTREWLTMQQFKRISPLKMAVHVKLLQ